MTLQARPVIATKPGIITLFLLNALLVSHGCGFHLRGSVALPDTLHTLSVETLENAPELNRILQKSLLSAGVNVIADAPYKVVLIDERFSRRVTAVNADTKASEYEMREVLIFSLQNREGIPVTEEQHVTVIKNYAYELDQVSGKQREEDLLRTEMRKEAVVKMMRQFQFLAL